MERLKIYIVVLLVTLSGGLYGQSSFSYNCVLDNNILSNGFKMSPLSDDKMGICYRAFNVDGINLLVMDGEGAKLEHVNVNSNMGGSLSFLEAQDSIYVFTNGSFEEEGMSVYNSESNTAWAKQLNYVGHNTASFNVRKFAGLGEGLIVCERSSPADSILGYQEHLSLSCFDYSGNSLWNYSYGANIYLYGHRIFVRPNQKIQVMGKWGTDLNNNFLLSLDNEGVIEDVFEYWGFQATDLQIDNEGNYFISGVAPGTVTSPNKKAVVLKLNSNFEEIWAYEYDIFGVINTGVALHLNEDGTIKILCDGFSDLPTILAHIDSDGSTILSQKGYAIRFVSAAFMEDGSVFMVSDYSYNTDFVAIDNQMLMMKTDTNGNIDGCSTYNSCLGVSPFEVIYVDTLDLTYEETDSLENFDVILTPLTEEFVPHCITPPPPTPYFETADTICINSCFVADTLDNRFAHVQEWNISFPDGTETILTDKLPELCFNQAGVYFIEQTIWFMGCDESYERVIEVLDNIDLDLGEDQIICETPYELTAITNRPPTSYLWNDGSTNESLTITESGLYKVAITDKYCTAGAQDSLNLTVVSYLIDLPIFAIPSDTSFCPTRYPVSLTLSDNTNVTFMVNGEVITNTSYEVNQAGSYLIQATFENCNFEHTINITDNDCAADIKLPYAFSPNEDGINDILQPIGTDFEVKSLIVYNRWGNIVSTSNEAWDGENAVADVYIVKVNYLNLISGMEETLFQEVTLLR